MRQLLGALRSKDLLEAERLLRELPEEDLPRLLGELPRADRAVAFRLLPKDRGALVFEDWPSPIAAELLEDLREEQTAAIFAGLDPDDRVQILDELPASVATRLLAGLKPAERSQTELLLGYPDDSVGRRMTTGVVTVHPGHSVTGALARFRRKAGGPDQVTVPVVSAGRVLVGVLPLHRLVTADPEQQISGLMDPPHWVSTDDDQETAARQIVHWEALDIPVVDREQRLVGLVQIADLVDILVEEEAEDSARSAGVEPLNRPYMSLSPFRLARARIIWLVVLLVAAFFTVGVLDHFQAALDQVIELALFVPLLIGTGGNTGAQAVTTVVRAMSVGDVTSADLARVVFRELRVGLMLGAGLGTLVFIPVTLIFGLPVAITLVLSLLSICVLATCAGATVPMIARRFGVDPAVVSAPFITTLVDATGLIIYFTIAGAVFGL